MKAQFAYLRGLDAFHEGQEIFVGVSPRRRRLDEPHVKQAMALFMEAYSSIQIAFLSPNLALPQRSLGLEMMSSMATEFMKYNMISSFEMSYWKWVMTELTAQKEYDQNKGQLEGQNRQIMFLKLLRMRLRQKQLLRALADLNQKLNTLEKQIKFVEPPRVRDIDWKP